MNLDKTSKQVLKYISDKSNGNLTEMIILTPQDSENLNMSMTQLVTVCQSLEESKHVKDFVKYIRNSGCRLYLTLEGYLYFSNKKAKTRIKIFTWLRDNALEIIAIIISIIALLKP